LARARALEAQGKTWFTSKSANPDFDTPPNVVEAGMKALKDGWTHYGPARGLPELRSAIADEIARTRGFKPSIEEVLVCPGAKPIMFYMILALIGTRRREVSIPNRDSRSTSR
jgi:aspartate/methionine/tyrosine aminotransferase